MPSCGSRALLVLLFVTGMWQPASTYAQLDPGTRQLSRDIFAQLIEINTTDSVGSTTIAADAMAKRLLDAGFAKEDVVVMGPNPRKGNMVARIKGSGDHKPILLIGHLDVVEARREDWTTDPFQFVEKDGYFYGRGTQDMKSGDAIMVTTFIRMKKEGYKPDRDIILALTADEEGGKSNGVDWLLKNHRDLIEAEYVLNHDGGGVDLKNGKPLSVDVDASARDLNAMARGVIVGIDRAQGSINLGGVGGARRGVHVRHREIHVRRGAHLIDQEIHDAGCVRPDVEGEVGGEVGVL